AHFFAMAARAMRRLLIEHARGRRSGVKVPLEAAEDFLRDEQIELALAIDVLLDDMAAEHVQWRSIIELKFFLGLTDEETAEALALPLRTMQRRFGDARRWLYERLKSCPAKPNTTSC